MNITVRQRRSGGMTLASAAVMLLLCGCSSFNRDWKRAAQTPAPASSLAGRWEGQWLSAVNGHHGRLRCLITERTNGVHEARFRATYLKMMTFSYTVPLDVVHSNALWHFAGETDLGKMAGGVYHYAGTATTTNFHSSYHSRHDHGTFEMARPAK